MPQPVLVTGARSPIGKLLGSLSSLSAAALGSTAICAALERAGITGDQVDAVIMGNVVQAGVGPNPARLAAVGGGIPMTVMLPDIVLANQEENRLVDVERPRAAGVPVW
jgi:acetyl-CoA C-acetyltransferase